MKKILLTAMMLFPLITLAQVITVVNGDFETPSSTGTTSVQNWSGDWYESNADMQVEVNNQISGTYSVRFTGAGVSNVRTLTTANARSFDVTFGHTYKVTFNCRIQTTAGASGGVNTDNNTFTGRAIETSSDGTVNGATLGSVSTQSPSNVALTFNFLVNTSTPKIKLQFTKDGGIAYLDDVTLEDLGVLPIKLVDFSSEVKESGVKLNWQTAQEINNQYFDLLRSVDGKNFTSIARINGAGNSTESKYYSYMDYAPQKGTNYYQLKQVDFDGKSTLSNVIAAKFGLADDGIKVSSVSDHDITLAITLSKAQQGIITYTSLDGKILYQKELNLVEGLNSVSVPTDQSFGKIGILSFSSASGRQSVKISR